MRSPRPLPTGIALLFVGSVCASASLLNDPGFEAATTGTQTSNSNWTLTVNFPDGVSPAAQFQESFAAHTGNMGVWFKSFEGAQSVGDALANAELMQMVAAVPGVYDLTFWLNLEANFTASAAFVELSTDVGDLASFNILTSPSGVGYQQYAIQNFVASAGTTKLTVRAVMVDGQLSQVNPQSLLFDDFNLTGPPGIPEPSSVGLLLGGLGLMGFLHRRRAARE